jgi:hypothetical protein
MKILTAIGVLLFVILILRALSSGSGVVVGVEDLPLTEDSVRKLLIQGLSNASSGRSKGRQGGGGTPFGEPTALALEFRGAT